MTQFAAPLRLETESRIAGKAIARGHSVAEALP
ncbi:hypothetical protein Isop_1024 [Isosphaera pallida ATCC 43644]|uniref:Uncharacterized protein n=1 Tax=Isosphaera pallida (strain ATCC 43644 / DSM 9630 / IS1B) TaxID=575540 RepID=E8R426_ISOPI|nr:hypothetical protein Isop_1024 [Isosphaera pallida ATCC 43644]